jgi:hypothetical protein
MKTAKEIKTILGNHKAEFEQQFSVKEIGVFGSVVRGEQTPSSDIDILVEFHEAISLFHFFDLEERLKTLLGAKVDLVSKKALKPIIGQQILSEVVYV